MSTKFKYIEKIYFDDVEGKIGNCYIYNLTFSQGYSIEPSTLTINSLSEDGDYSTIPSPNFDDIYTIKIGSKIIFRGFIISKEIQTSQQNKVANITLVDKSIRLDQYGIGLTNRHGEMPLSPRDITVSANGVNAIGQIVRTADVTFSRELAEGVKRYGNVFVIGREKITSSPCDIPDVEYLQEHFDKAISLFSAEVGITFNSLPSIISGRNYTGTIREVLNSLCSDSGKSFYYDSFLDSVVLFNLDAKFIDDSVIDLLKSDENVVIQNYSELESLENTYGNFVSVREMRPGKESGGEGTCTNHIVNNLYWMPVEINHKVNSPLDGGQGGNADIIAGVLGKYSEGLRDHFHINRRDWSAVDWWNVVQLWGQGGHNGIKGEYQNFEYDRDDSGTVSHFEKWTEFTTSQCLDERADDPFANIYNSKCTIDRIAGYLNMDPSEVQQIFDNNPALYGGFDLYAANVGDGSYKESRRSVEEESTKIFNGTYQAAYDPVSLQHLENTIQGPKELYPTHCTLVSIKQEPEPQWIEEDWFAGWGYVSDSSWEIPQDDLSDILGGVIPTIVDVTADMVYTKYLGIKTRSLRRGDLDGVDPRDANFDDTIIRPTLSDGQFGPPINLSLPTFDLTPIKHSHIIFLPRASIINNISSAELSISTALSAGGPIGNVINPDNATDCVPAYVVENRKYKKGDSGCQGSCSDQTLDEEFEDLSVCGQDLPSGEICQLHRMGISVELSYPTDSIKVAGAGNFFVDILGPKRSANGYRSRLLINYKKNTTTFRSLKINTFQKGTNFSKLNVNDIDATSSLFDPESEGNHHVIPESVGVTYDDVLSSAQQVYGSFSKGSSENGLPRKISMSIIGMPTQVDKVLNQSSISTYNINYGTEGLSMSLQYSDVPQRPPTMDYLQSRLHNQFHYATINKFHR